MKKTLLFLVGIICCNVVLAENAESVTQALLKQTMDRGIEILKQDSADVDTKINEFEVLLKKQCHTDLMAKLVLGRSGWMKLPADRRSDFIHAFIQMVTSSYYSKMDMADLSTVKIVYGENKEVSPVKRAIYAQIKDDTDTYHLEYKFAYLNDRWGIYDLEVEGISLLASYRAEYADYLAQHTGSELIEMLEKKAKEVTQ